MSDLSRPLGYKNGFKKGIPIALGYLPVSFTFGFMAVSNGLPVWMTVLISMSNLTSSGQFAGTQLILAGAGYLEITITTFIINLRYMLMSLALSQKLDPAVRILDRMILAFGITDETFAVSSLEKSVITRMYFYGLITAPYFGWALGTLAGATASGVLPQGLQGAMGIALYAMFIALIIPPSRNSVSFFLVVLIAIAISCMIRYVPIFHFISTGFRVIIATLVASVAGALLFPEKEKYHG